MTPFRVMISYLARKKEMYSSYPLEEQPIQVTITERRSKYQQIEFYLRWGAIGIFLTAVVGMGVALTTTSAIRAYWMMRSNSTTLDDFQLFAI